MGFTTGPSQDADILAWLLSLTPYAIAAMAPPIAVFHAKGRLCPALGVSMLLTCTLCGLPGCLHATWVLLGKELEDGFLKDEDFAYDKVNRPRANPVAEGSPQGLCDMPLSEPENPATQQQVNVDLKADKSGSPHPTTHITLDTIPGSLIVHHPSSPKLESPSEQAQYRRLQSEPLLRAKSRGKESGGLGETAVSWQGREGPRRP